VLSRALFYHWIGVPVLRTICKFFHHDESGQDLAEYCLLTALVALIALGIVFRVSGGLDGIWGSANSTLAVGNSINGASVGGSTGN
jgi:Flp pilus assembly pilin Flp